MHLRRCLLLIGHSVASSFQKQLLRISQNSPYLPSDNAFGFQVLLQVWETWEITFDN